MKGPGSVDSSTIDTLEIFETLRPTSPKGHRLARILGEIGLTLAALFGLLVTAITVTAARSGVQPMVIRSGSMEPTIGTGSMVLTRRIDASEIKVGDVVAVERPDRTTVTHRVVTVELNGDAAELTLKGDANKDPDPFPITARHAQRVMGEVPNLGRATAWLATAQGGFAMGCAATAFVMRAVRRRSQGRDG
jgi:signal peptidase